jgi:amidase
VPVDRETREMCVAAARRFEELGAVVEEACPELGDIEGAFLPLRSQHYVVERELMLAEHRDLIKPDIVWNTELGLKQTPSDIAAAERERAKLFRNTAAFFETYDLLVTPGASTPAFDVMRRMPEMIDGRKLEHYLGASLITAIPTLMGMPSIAVPCGFDQFARPVGIQIVGQHRGEAALLSAAHLFEQITGLASQVPIDPKPAKALAGIVSL